MAHCVPWMNLIICKLSVCYQLLIDFYSLSYLPSDGAQVETLYSFPDLDQIYVAYDNFQLLNWDVVDQKCSEGNYSDIIDSSFISIGTFDKSNLPTLYHGSCALLTDNLVTVFLDAHDLVLNLNFSNENYIEKTYIDEFLDFIQPPFLNSDIEMEHQLLGTVFDQSSLHLGVGKPDGNAILRFDTEMKSIINTAPNCSALLLYLYFSLMVPLCKYDGLSDTKLTEGILLKLKDLKTVDYSISVLSYVWNNSGKVMQGIIKSMLSRTLELISPEELQRLIYYYFEFFTTTGGEYYLKKEVQHSLYILSLIVSLRPSAFDVSQLKFLSSYLLQKSESMDYDLTAIRLLSNGFSVFSKHIDPAKFIYNLVLSSLENTKDLDDKNSILYRSIVDVSVSNAVLLLTCLCDEVYEQMKSNLRSVILKVVSLAIENTQSEFSLFNQLITEKLLPILYSSRSVEEVHDVTNAIATQFPFACFDSKVEKYSYIDDGDLVVYEIAKRRKVVSKENAECDIQVLSASPSGDYFVGVSATQKECIIWKYSQDFVKFLNLSTPSLTIRKRILLQTNKTNEVEIPEVLWISQSSAEVHIGSTFAIIDL